MKKYAVLFLVAVAGGIIALASYKAMENSGRGKGHFFPDPLPVRQAGYASGIPVNGPDFTLAAEKSIHSVVHIKTEYQQKTTLYDFFFRDFWDMNPGGRGRPFVATGSGVIITEDGYIVTNNHVVQDADYIEVTLNDKRTYEARIVGNDPGTDIALIKIAETALPCLIFGNSDQVRVGEWVLAVGNPFNLTSTVTAGIVSAKARNINILGSNSAIESFIQTDAVVNPGNSGGALVNTLGELVGINAAIASNTGSYTGYSFAIPSNLVRKVAEDLREFGITQRGYLGLTPADITAELAREKGLPSTKGVYVYDVSDNGSAKMSGIASGDVITRINDQTVNSVSEMLELIGQHRPGDKIDVSYLRSSTEKTVSLTLRNKEGTLGLIRKGERNVRDLLGADIDALTKDEKRWLRIDYGVKVKNLREGLFLNQGIKENFIIISIDKNIVKEPSDVERILSDKKGGVLLEGMYPNRMRAYYMIVIKDE